MQSATFDIVTQVDTRVRSKRLPGKDCVVLFRLTASQDTLFAVVVRSGQAQVVRGPYSRPDASVKLSYGDAVQLLSGRLNATVAVLTGRVKVEGSQGSAMRVADFLKP